MKNLCLNCNKPLSRNKITYSAKYCSESCKAKFNAVKNRKRNKKYWSLKRMYPV